jgi:hypothetical protein
MSFNFSITAGTYNICSEHKDIKTIPLLLSNGKSILITGDKKEEHYKSLLCNNFAQGYIIKWYKEDIIISELTNYMAIMNSFCVLGNDVATDRVIFYRMPMKKSPSKLVTISEDTDEDDYEEYSGGYVEDIVFTISHSEHILDENYKPITNIKLEYKRNTKKIYHFMYIKVCKHIGNNKLLYLLNLKLYYNEKRDNIYYFDSMSAYAEDVLDRYNAKVLLDNKLLKHAEYIRFSVNSDIFYDLISGDGIKTIYRKSSGTLKEICALNKNIIDIISIMMGYMENIKDYINVTILKELHDNIQLYDNGYFSSMTLMKKILTEYTTYSDDPSASAPIIPHLTFKEYNKCFFKKYDYDIDDIFSNLINIDIVNILALYQVMIKYQVKHFYIPREQVISLLN